MSSQRRVLLMMLLLGIALVSASSVSAKPALRVHVKGEVDVTGTRSSGSYSGFMRAKLSRKVSTAKAKKLEAQYRPRGKTRLKLGKKTYPGGHFTKGSYDSSSHVIVWYGSTVHKNLFKQIGKKATLRFHTHLGKRRVRVPIKQAVAE